METFTPYSALTGGIIIGLAAAGYLYLHGRICGISGMVSDLAHLHSNLSVSGFFMLGILFGGIALRYFYPQALEFEIPLSLPGVICAGFLVGLGSRIAGGCTSGHGVCGVGMYSKRSIAATCVFVFFGMLTATIVYHFFIGDPHP